MLLVQSVKPKNSEDSYKLDNFNSRYTKFWKLDKGHVLMSVQEITPGGQQGEGGKVFIRHTNKQIVVHYNKVPGSQYMALDTARERKKVEPLVVAVMMKEDFKGLRPYYRGKGKRGRLFNF